MQLSREIFSQYSDIAREIEMLERKKSRNRAVNSETYRRWTCERQSLWWKWWFARVGSRGIPIKRVQS